ncbi:hypothetical protein C4569_03895 [Candidatus Parcubacteria bacterium]|nr:MAG: hypothetical protein C4569_03895 [Candidatus Parcubacteria bacterium]
MWQSTVVKCRGLKFGKRVMTDPVTMKKIPIELPQSTDDTLTHAGRAEVICKEIICRVESIKTTELPIKQLAIANGIMDQIAHLEAMLTVLEKPEQVKPVLDRVSSQISENALPGTFGLTVSNLFKV